METVEDILREMEETARMYLSGGNDSLSVFEMLSTYHDRLEAAYKNLPGMWIVPAENAKLREENARLKAALKPVLDIHLTQDDKTLDVYDSRLDAAESVRAVREAQRIYNGGEE